MAAYFTAKDMKKLFCCLIVLLGSALAKGAAADLEKAVEGWNSVTLWTNQTVTARIRHKPVASLADRNWIALELENHTPAPLELTQVRLSMDQEAKDGSSGKMLYLGDFINGTFPYLKIIPPGVSRHFGQAFDHASSGMRPPPNSRLRIEVSASGDISLQDGRTIDSHKNKVPFVLEWRHPTSQEITAMKLELKALLTEETDYQLAEIQKQRTRIRQHPLDPAKAIANGRTARIGTLLAVEAIKDNVTPEDILPLLKVTTLAGSRFTLIRQIFPKYSSAPPVVTYYREAFQQEPDNVYWDAALPEVWNEEFLEPLIRGCEQGKFHYFSALQRHPKEWKPRPELVSRISSALLKQQIFQQNLAAIEDMDKLREWRRAVDDIADTGDHRLIARLSSALEDRRMIPSHPNASNREPEFRVCDHAMFAILKILDGDQWAAFKKAGLTPPWGIKDETGACDRMLPILRGRLKSLAAER